MAYLRWQTGGSPLHETCVPETSQILWEPPTSLYLDHTEELIILTVRFFNLRFLYNPCKWQPRVLAWEPGCVKLKIHFTVPGQDSPFVTSVIDFGPEEEICEDNSSAIRWVPWAGALLPWKAMPASISPAGMAPRRAGRDTHKAGEAWKAAKPHT